MSEEDKIHWVALQKKLARDQIKEAIRKLKRLGDSDEAIVMILQGLHGEVKRGRR